MSAARRATLAVTLALALALRVATARIVRADDPPDAPPPESPEGADYTIETADAPERSDVVIGLGASGRAGRAPTERRRVSFRGDGVSGSLRDGSDDPLAGGSIEAGARGGTFTIGRLAPRWGRGLLLGAAAEPWQRDASDRGARAPFRGRSGDGIMMRRGDPDGIEALVGRFAHRGVAGARGRFRAVALGALSDGRARHQGSLTLAHARGASELAFDTRGGWRAETMIERRLAADDTSRLRDWTVSLRARAGCDGFASLAEPARRGPSRAIAAGLDGTIRGARLRALAALWRFRPGVPGARAGLAVARPLAHHNVLALGIEEQRGSRRDPSPSASSAAAAQAASLRQGGWAEWRGGEGTVALGLRHERWGERAWLRGAVRAVTSARLETRGPAGLALAITHTVFAVKRGENLYLAESESDRVVLRALAGEGSRTRIEAHAPLAGGRVRATLNVADVTTRAGRPEWTLDWTRRVRASTRKGEAGARER
ncbi:MAG: hypothetical protein HY076_04065 [Candidatus Eisenbacteria bacterium]|uniref:Uncharacterized protein n=1 Tax=Eiseniibacteriota bacterium TaxID=2212470 RepID=A0A9D6L5T1_UNCEI|nr:hypothetical protein [Candidatus Eisenbacteria bacterium]